jgi:hypothetical protein
VCAGDCDAGGSPKHGTGEPCPLCDDAAIRDQALHP